MKIRREEISEYVEHYNYDVESEARLKAQIKQRFKKGKRYLTKNLFFNIAAWKTKRQRKHYENNPQSLVEEVSRISFEKRRSERVRIEVLTILDGVNYPVASTLLHFAFPNRYPILDFRVIWSLGMEKPASYSFHFWWDFVNRMRTDSKKLGLSIRDFDKALWAYSKENQLGKRRKTQ